jgi:signal transduction histidine kinase
VTVIDDAGQIIARTPDREAWTGMRIDLNAISPTLAVRGDGLWEGMFLDNVSRVVAFHQSVRAPWQILVGFPRATAYAPIVRSLWRGFLVVAIVFGFAMLLAVYFGRRLTRPLQRLAETASAVVGDQLPDPVVVQGEDEVAELSIAFNKMLAELRRQIEQLSGMQAVQEADRLKSELLASVSHELKTPLGSIKGFASALQQEDVALDRATQLDFLATIEADADRLTRLVEDVLDMSRIEAGALHLRRELCSVGELITATIGRLQRPLAEHTVQVALPVELPPVFVDPERIEQVLYNLVDNAIKYSPAGTSIRITTWATGKGQASHHEAREIPPNMVAVSVEDEGIGIPPEDLERVFERFWRADSGRRRRASGTGLGLAICMGIVAAHGGQIWAENKPNAGCRVTFTIPRSRTGASFGAASGESQPADGAARSPEFDLGRPFRGNRR